MATGGLTTGVPEGFEPVTHSPALIEFCRAVGASRDGTPFFFGGDFEWHVYSDGARFIVWERGKGNPDGYTRIRATDFDAIERTLAEFLSGLVRGPRKGLPWILVPYGAKEARKGYRVHVGGFGWKDREKRGISRLNPLSWVPDGWWTARRPDGTNCPIGFESSGAAGRYTHLDPFSVEEIIQSLLAPDGAPAFKEFVHVD